jgi:BolA protein
MSIRVEIQQKLKAAFSPTEILVRDDSAAHAGHAGAPAGGESHFHVQMRAESFTRQSRIARHRAVHNALGAELMGRIHALSLDLDG